MFVNEAVPVEALDPSFGPWAREFATQEVVRVLTETGRPWMAATDDLYLHHRMQRWAGVTETAVCLDREVVNPMLDDRFISIATALDPLDKRNSRFLSRLQLELDAELGSLPLDGRPAPAAYAHRSVRNSARQTAATVGKARSKVLQRLRRETRPPAGGEILADKVVAHWRDDPGALEPLHRPGRLRGRSGSSRSCAGTHHSAQQCRRAHRQPHRSDQGRRPAQALACRSDDGAVVVAVVDPHVPGCRRVEVRHGTVRRRTVRLVPRSNTLSR